MSSKYAELLLLLVIASRSTSYLLSKIGLATIPPLELLGIRFSLAFIILCLIFHGKLKKITRQTMAAGLLLGAVLFSCMTLEAFSLTMIDLSMAAFLENTAVIWVLLLEAVLLRRIPSRSILSAAAVIVCGVFLLTLHGTTLFFSWGIALCLAASICYAIWIILTDRFAHTLNPLIIGILQIGVLAVLSCISTILWQEPFFPTQRIEWEVILTLVFVCTILGFTFQPVAQKYTSATHAGLFTAFNPLIAAVLGHTVLSENFGLSQLFGGALILSGILFVQLCHPSSSTTSLTTDKISSQTTLPTKY